MKLAFAILASLIAVAYGDVEAAAFRLYNPNAMFTEALSYQTRVTDLQEDIVTVITGLRSQLSGILKRTSNATLTQVQDNIWKVFEMDAPVRELLFITNNRSTDCIHNLRVQLNMDTEFTGYEASNCLLRYNSGVTALTDSAYGTLAEYEGKITIIQMLVVDAFNGINIWTDPEAILTIIKNNFETENTAWTAIKANINSFLSTLEGSINSLNTVLGTCFSAIQADLDPEYQKTANKTLVCDEFDASA